MTNDGARDVRAISSFSSIIVYSMDGVNWNQANTDPTILYVDMWYIPEASKWIAYGSVVNSDMDNSPQSYSNDGINWIQFNFSSIFNGDDTQGIPGWHFRLFIRPIQFRSNMVTGDG
jgi:hypothetical protein